MNYVLIFIGYMPEYINYLVNSILSVDKDAEIFICYQKNYKLSFKNVKHVFLEDIESMNLDRFNDLKVYENTIFESNPLWNTSAQRIFYLQQIIKELDLKNVIHFDNDVVIYKPFADNVDSFNKDKFNITPYNNKKLIFGYSYLEKMSILDFVCESYLDICSDGKESGWLTNNNKPLTEMEVLKKIEINNEDLFNLLPTQPYEGKTIFDPAGYGQYLDGTHANPKKLGRKGFISNNDSIGIEIRTKRINVKFNKSPIITWEGDKYGLSNLHVHSKRLVKFLPTNYKNFL